MFSENSMLKEKTPVRFYAEKNSGLRNRFINARALWSFTLPKAEKSANIVPLRKNLNAFERYLKSCNNDGHKLQESYYDSAKTKLMSRCVVDKNGRLDGPCLRYSDDGKTMSYGWYRKGKIHGKWVRKSSNDDVSKLVSFYDKKGEKISPDTTVFEGKLDKFWYDSKTDCMYNIMRGGKPTALHKETKKKQIAQMKKDGKSGVVKVDEKLAELREKIQHKQPEQSTAEVEASYQPKVMRNAIKFAKNNELE